MVKSHNFNPITKSIAPIQPVKSAPSLQQICRNAILKQITVQNQLQAVEQLPLPRRLRQKLCTLTLDDFFIDAERLPADCHVTELYPATCNLDGANVNLRIAPLEREPNKSDLRYLNSFDEGRYTIIVEERTRTLTQVIQQCRATDDEFEEHFIWLFLEEFVNYLSVTDIAPTSHISTSCIHFLPDYRIFIHFEVADTGSNRLEFESHAAVYEAPEVLASNSPDCRAIVWSVGCILYEILALRPAFYDKDGVNPFQVYMGILNGILPPELETGSTELKHLVKSCLVHDVNNRINLTDLLQMIAMHFGTAL